MLYNFTSNIHNEVFMLYESFLKCLDPTSSWIFEGPYGAAWLKIELRYAYILHRINLMQTFCKCSSINEIELTYSDLSTQKVSSSVHEE